MAVRLQFNKVLGSRPKPGLFGSKQNWGSIQKALGLKLDRTIISLDMRNHGDSPHTQVHDYASMASDVKLFIQEQGYDCVDLIGHSMGGKVAINLALDNLDTINLEKLIVVDMGINPTGEAEVVSKNPSLFLKYIKAMRKIEPIPDKKIVDLLLMDAIPELAVRQFLLTNLKRDHDGKYCWRVNLSALEANLETLFREPLRPRGAKNEIPALFIKGGLSDYITNDMTERIMTLFPNAEIKTVANAGHWVHADQPKIFLDIVAKFLF